MSAKHAEELNPQVITQVDEIDQDAEEIDLGALI